MIHSKKSLPRRSNQHLIRDPKMTNHKLPAIRKITALLILLCTATFAQQKGTFTDARDGKKYKTVKIGTQIWMAENLNYAAEHSRCGGTNPQVDKYGFKTYFVEEKDTENCRKYGRLYNWYAAMESCPEGWHLPRVEEWTTLGDFAYEKFGSAISSLKAKDKGKWENCKGVYDLGPQLDAYKRPMVDKNGRAIRITKPYDYCPTDKSGFSALPSGHGKYDDGEFCICDGEAWWWTVEEADGVIDDKVFKNAFAFIRTLDHNIGYSRRLKTDWISVRCLRD